MQPARWLSLLVATILIAGIAADPLAGGPGLALYFKAANLDILGTQWHNQEITNSKEFSISFWIYIVDTNQDESLTFSYSAYDPSTKSESPDELHIRILPTGVRLNKGVASFTCATTNCSGWYQSNSWNHFALTYNAHFGTYGNQTNIKIYKNAELVDNKLFENDISANTWANPLLPGGCFHFSQDADVLCGGFDTAQALDGLIDSLHVYSNAKTQSFFQSSYKKSFIKSGGVLNLAYEFEQWDDSVNPVQTPDDGNGASPGLVGGLPLLNNLASLADGSTPRTPGAPKFVYSGAPVVGSGNHYFAIDPNGGPVTLSLGAIATPRAVSVTIDPVNGTLSAIDGGATLVYPDAIIDSLNHPEYVRVVYTPNPSWTGDWFGFQVAENAVIAQANVFLRPIDTTPTTPGDQSITIVEDSWLMLKLSGLSDSGTKFLAVITQLPTRGKLYQAGFTSTTTSYKFAQTNPALLTQISQSNTSATNPNSAFQYFPNAHEYSATGVVFDTIKFKWMDNSTGSQSAGEATVSIYVTAVNDAPTAQSIQKTATSLLPIKLQLNSSDVDTNFAPHPFYFISAWPKVGTIYQALPDGSIGEIIEQRDRLPNLEALPKQVLAASSTFTKCCSVPCSCNVFGACPDCTLVDFHPTAVLTIDIYPKTADAAGGWEASIFSTSPTEWIELEYPEEVYLTSINIYETFNPGVIDHVYVATEYAGAATNWTEVWSSPFPGGAPVVDSVARIFSPPLCPVNVKGRYIRVEGNYKARPGYHGIDAIQRFGVTDLHIGIITDDSGLLYYAPPKGVFSAGASSYDEFTYVASDCEARSATPATVRITLPSIDDAPVGEYYNNGTTSFGVGTVSTLNLPLADILTSLQQRTGNSSLSIADIVIKINSLSSDGVQIGQFSPDNQLTALEPPFIVSDSQGRLLMNIDAEQGPFDIEYTVSILNFAFSMNTRVSLDCPENQYPSSAGPCRPCAEITEEQINSMGSEERAFFEGVCSLTFAFSSGIRIAFLALSALGIAGVIACFIAVIRFLDHSIIKASSPPFAFLILAGAIMALAVVPFAYPTDPSLAPWTCIIQPWLGNLGYGLVFSALFAKTYRLSQIFNNTKMRTRVIPNAYLARIVAVVCAIIAVYLIVWTAVDRPLPVLVKKLNVSYYVCSSQQIFWMPALLAAEFLFLVWGAYLCWKVRNTPSAFNESKFIAFALYNMVVIAVIIVCLVYAFRDLNPDIVFLFMSLGLVFAPCITVGLLYVPKFHGIYNNVVLESSHFKRTNSLIGSFPGATSHSSELSNVSSEEMEKMKARTSELAKKNAELEQKIRRLESQLAEAKSRGADSDDDGNDTGSDSDKPAPSKKGETVVMIRDQSKHVVKDNSDSEEDSDSDKKMSKKASGRLDIAKKKEGDIKKDTSREDIPIKKSSSKGDGLAKSPSKGGDSSIKTEKKEEKKDDDSSSKTSDDEPESPAAAAVAEAPKPKAKKAGGKKKAKKAGGKKKSKE